MYGFCALKRQVVVCVRIALSVHQIPKYGQSYAHQDYDQLRHVQFFLAFDP